MEIGVAPQRFGKHPNAFGFLRLLFASLVIVSHTPELIDGDRHRELLTRMTGTLSFGDLAVSGFFLISGFLITGSFENSRSVQSYLAKRIVRIYPSFVAASLFCLIIVAPFSGAPFTHDLGRSILAAVVRMALLARPMVQGAFPGQNYNDPGSALDGAMWTIQYEFACYLLVIILAASGALRRPGLLLLFSAVLLIVAHWIPDGTLAGLSHPMLFPAAASAMFRLTGMFVAGAAFYKLQAHLRSEPIYLLAAAAGLAATLPVTWCVDLGLALFGGYLMFASASLAGESIVGKINNKTDISYGLYLYAAPVERLLIRYAGMQNLVLLGAATWLGAAALGWLSWTLLEKPAMRRLQNRNP